MPSKNKIVVGILVAFIAVAAITLTQATADQPLTNHDLYQQISDLDSFASEVLLILDQYDQDKLDFTYLKNQTAQIDKSVNDFYSEIETKVIEESQQQDVSNVEALVFQFGLQLKLIESSDGNRAALDQIAPTIQKLQQQIQESERQYA
jgi:hypothetical protein